MYFVLLYYLSYLKTAMLNNTTLTKATNSTNGTGAGHGPRLPPSRQVDVVAMVFSVFFCILALMIVFGNSLVIGAFRVNRRLRRTTNLLLMFLAIADLLIGTVSVPLWVYISVTYTTKGPLYYFYLTFDVICGVSSILNLTAISLERCYALLHPIKHRNIRKRKSQYSLLVLQGGLAFRALDLKFDGPEFKSRPDH